MKQYQELLKNILDKGTWKEPARNNMPRTKSLFGTKMEFDSKEGFPLLTTKKVYFKGIVTELLWFLRGGTNIKYLVDNGCNIWNQDAYRWYLKWFKEETDDCFHESVLNPMTMDEFIQAIKDGQILSEGEDDYELGDLGKVYGYQWRNQNGVDQIKEVFESLKSDPYSRYHIIDGWNKSDFKDMALPPCHLLYQFNCRPLSDTDRKLLLSEKEGWEDQFHMIDEDPCGDMMDICDKEGVPKYYLDLQMYQRSCDTFLGVPFNIASSTLLLWLFASALGYEIGNFTWVGGDTHIYENHLEQVKEQLSREPYYLPSIVLSKHIHSLEDILHLEPKDISIKDYNHHPAIKAELKTGL